MAKKRLIIFIALVIIVVLVFLPGFSRYQKLLSEERILKKRITELEKANKRLEEERVMLETDIDYIEERAREILGIVKEDEIPYRIMEEGGEE